MSEYNQEFIDLLKAIIVQTIKKEIKNREPIIWTEIFDKLKYQIRYYADIERYYADIERYGKEKEKEKEKGKEKRDDPIYPIQTFDDFIAARGDIAKLGPYDYTEFYKNLRDPLFLTSMKSDYAKSENLKLVKQSLADAALSGYEPDYIDAIPFYSYISLHGISVEKEPVYKNNVPDITKQGQEDITKCFRDKNNWTNENLGKMQEFYKHYTLWYMNEELK